MNRELKSLNGKLDFIASDVKGVLYAIREFTEKLSPALSQVEIHFNPLPVSVSNTSVPGVNPVWSSRDQGGCQTSAPGQMTSRSKTNYWMKRLMLLTYRP